MMFVPFARLGSWLRILILVLLLGILGVLGERLARETRYGSLGTVDFVQFWSAASLLLEGDNPYDPQLLQRVQKGLGRPGTEPLLMWNPPWLLIVLFPVLSLDFSLATLLWLTLNLGMVLASGSFIWRFFGGPSGPGLWLAWLSSVFYFPFLLCWGVGQTACLALVGVVLFLLGEQRKSPWLGAAGVLLISCKPQIVYLFCVVALVRVVREKNWKLPSASALLLAIAAIFLTILRPSWLADYVGALGQPPHYWATPTLGGVLREYFHVQSSLLQYLAPIAAIGGALLLMNSKRGFSWRQSISPILLASSLSSPFGWSYDQVILLFPCLESLVQVVVSRSMTPARRTAIVLAVVGYSGCQLLLNLLGISEVHRFWLGLLPLIALGLSRARS